MEPDLINEFVPGDAQLQGIAPAYNAMVNENLFIPQGNIPIREMATKATKNIATNYALKKLGIDGLTGNVLGSVIGGGLASLNPIALFTMGSTLPDPVKGIAGYLRNKQMAEYADALIAFWDGESKGTKHMIDLAKKNGLKVRIVNY